MAISIRELLEAGAHFGHQTHRWNPKMKPYIYGARNGIYIIDLQQTARMWQKAYEAVVETVRRGKKVLFVGTKPQAQEVVEEEANRCGQFYVNRRWLGGMLTNFKTIKARIDRLDDLDKILDTSEIEKISKKDGVTLRKERQKLVKSLGGIKKMTHLPGILVVVDPNKEHIAVAEARKLNIPIISVTDTNCNPDGIDFLVPANDDALKSIRLFMHDVAEAALEGSKQFEKVLEEEANRRLQQDDTTVLPHEAAAPHKREEGGPIVEVKGSTRPASKTAEKVVESQTE